MCRLRHKKYSQSFHLPDNLGGIRIENDEVESSKVDRLKMHAIDKSNDYGSPIRTNSKARFILSKGRIEQMPFQN